MRATLNTAGRTDLSFMVASEPEETVRGDSEGESQGTMRGDSEGAARGTVRGQGGQ